MPDSVLKRVLVCSATILSMAMTAFSASDKNPGHLNMGLVNMKCLYSDGSDIEANKKNIRANLDRHIYFIDKLAAQGVEFIGFPECSINGYHYSTNMTWLSLAGPEVEVLKRKAKEKGVYISAGIAEQDTDGKRWENQFVIGPDGKIVGWHRKNWLTKERGFIEASTDHNVLDVKGTKIGIAICADGTDFRNIKALVDNGAKIIYGPHANTTGGTIAGWYNFRARWGGPWDGKFMLSKDANNTDVEMPTGGWIAQLKVYAALHNFAGLYNPEFNPPVETDSNTGWASGAWFIGPDGQTLAQMPTSTQKGDSKEFVLIRNIPIASR